MQIVKNKSASHNYHLEKPIEAGLVLEGWEVKSLRAGKVNIKESHVFVQDGEMFVSNLTITPLNTTCNYTKADSTRVRKLLLNRHEIDKIFGQISQKGFTCMPVDLHWSKGRVKMNIALAKGKKLHDKRQDLKDKAIKRDTQRALKGN
ncbi:SsrA-binding protein SmpB [Vibrio owensii]|uniref:SsrA-binding protein SmpB n=1 Tax=Vibrio harveyi group TaxID=717610 RepID=UPI003CC5B785